MAHTTTIRHNRKPAAHRNRRQPRPMVIPPWLVVELRENAPEGINLGRQICITLKNLARNWERHGERQVTTQYNLGENLPNRIAEQAHLRGASPSEFVETVMGTYVAALEKQAEERQAA